MPAWLRQPPAILLQFAKHSFFDGYVSLQSAISLENLLKLRLARRLLKLS